MLSHMSPLLASPSADDQWPACKVCDVPRTCGCTTCKGAFPRWRSRCGLASLFSLYRPMSSGMPESETAQRQSSHGLPYAPCMHTLYKHMRIMLLPSNHHPYSLMN